MKAYLPKTPSVIKRLFSKYTWCFASNKKEIFLTFDDGPTPDITEFVLSELRKYNAKATFFCIGKNIKNHPDIFKQIISDGHTVGNHTQNHLNGWKTRNTTYINNVLECEKYLNNIKSTSKIFRPPYGKIKKHQAKELFKKGYKIILWDVLSADFDTSISKEKCLSNVINNTKKGSIVVFHDSVKASERMQYALSKMLEYFSERGYVFKAIK